MSAVFILFARESLNPFQRKMVMVHRPIQLSANGRHEHRPPNTGFFSFLTRWFFYLLPQVKCLIGNKETLLERVNVKEASFTHSQTLVEFHTEKLQRDIHEFTTSLIDPIDTFSRWYYNYLAKHKLITLADITVEHKRSYVNTKNEFDDTYDVIMSPLDFLKTFKGVYQYTDWDIDLLARVFVYHVTARAMGDKGVNMGVFVDKLAF